MPFYIANTLLSFVPDRSSAVRGPDRVGAVSPMFNEEAGAGPALASLLTQSEPFDELAVSVNGGSDATLQVVRATLEGHGYARVYAAPAPDFDGSWERWYREGGPGIVVLDHAAPISKADSINKVVEGGYLSCERVLVVDGDTIFDRDFLHRLKDNFYRLTRERRQGGGWRYIIEDVGIQSGAVTSLPPEPGSPVGGWISRSRAAEYAVAATLRRGQTTRLGSGRLFGRSRLYTVVGCGFVVRRASFPMPADTLTEDHDFTLQVQNEERTEVGVSVAELQERGFKLRLGGRDVDPAHYFQPEDELVLRRGGEARFVTGALMHTEDPLSLSGYLRQVERWNGGGIENFIKRLRLRDGLRPNVAFAAGAAQLENQLNLLFLLLIMPVLFGIHTALPGYRFGLYAAAVWFGLDLLTTLLLVSIGFARIWRAHGDRGWRLGVRTWSSAVATSFPFMTLRLINPLAYVVALTRTLPRALRSREEDARVTITWERPRARVAGPVVTRASTVGLSLALVCVLLFGGAFYVAESARPGYKETWRLLHAVDPIRAEEHVVLPLRSVVDLVDSWEPLEASLPWLGGGGAPPGLFAVAHGDDESGLSEYCSVGYTANPAPERRLLGGDAGAYAPLTYWERLVLARLLPLAAIMEEAATAYDVPPKLLLLVLINESFLDPLAVGPTEDYGLSQVTGDALTLLRAISEPGSRFANPRLVSGQFSVFDPDFSICAGAAKLAWARAQPGGEDDRYAYARYINPLEGVRRDGLNPVHEVLVAALADLEPLADALLDAFALFRLDEGLLTEQERAFFEIYAQTVGGELGVRGAYAAVHELVREFGIDDGRFYDELSESLYGQGLSTAGLPRSR